MLGLLMFVIVILIISFNVMYLVYQKEQNIFSLKIISTRILITSSIQVIWTIAYLFYVYLYSQGELIAIVTYFIASYVTKLTMDKKIIKLRYWFISNLVISPVLTSIWIRYDTSPFQGPFGSIGMLSVLLVIPVINLIGQLSIWLFIKFQKLLPHDKQKEKQALKITVIQDIKILCFQVLLSMVLAGALILNNLFVSYLIITLSLYILFIIRKKISGDGIFWIISWIIIFDQTMTMVFQYFPEEARRYLEATQRKFEVWYLIIFIIYHILLTKFFKLKAERGESQNY